MSKPDPQAPVSTGNIATIIGIQPAKLSVGNLSESIDNDISLPMLYGIGNTSDTYNVINGYYTQNIFHLSLDGTENWTAVAGEGGGDPYFSMPLSVASVNFAPVLCTHFEPVDYANNVAITAHNTVKGCCVTQNELRIRPSWTNFEWMPTFISYLGAAFSVGLPVRIFYKRLTSSGSVSNAFEVLPKAGNFGYLHVTNDVDCHMTIQYCCDSNLIMHGGNMAQVLTKNSSRDLDFAWKTLSASDVSAASVSAFNTLETRVTDIENSPSNAFDFIPYVRKTKVGPSIGISNASTAFGFTNLILRGKTNVVKPNPALPISPNNIATITDAGSLTLTVDPSPGAPVNYNIDHPEIFGIGNTFDRYDLICGTCHRMFARYQFTGTENWSVVSGTEGGSNHFFVTLSSSAPTAASPLAEQACTHFEVVDYLAGINIAPSNSITGISIVGQNVRFRSVPGSFEDLDGFKNYLAAQHAGGTPVTLHYRVYSPSLESRSAYAIAAPASATITNNKNIVMEISYVESQRRLYGTTEDFIEDAKVFTSITNNEEYRFSFIPSLTILPIAIPSERYSFTIYFRTGMSISVSLPVGIKWGGDKIPSFESGKVYELSVKDGLALVEVYDGGA